MVRLGDCPSVQQGDHLPRGVMIGRSIDDVRGLVHRKVGVLL